MGSKYNNKPIKRDDPSLNLEGGSPGRLYQAPKYKQLSIPGLRLAKMKQRKTNDVNQA